MLGWLLVANADSACAQTLKGAGVRFEQGGVLIEAFAIPTETETEVEIASRGIAVEISKGWIPGKSEFEAVVADTPTDGIYPKAENLRKVYPRKMMDQLRSHLKKTRIVPTHSSVIKLAPTFGSLRHMHIAMGKGYWGYTLVRITIAGSYAYRGVIVGHSPVAMLSAAIDEIERMVDFEQIHERMRRTPASIETKSVIHASRSAFLNRLIERKQLERTLEASGGTDQNSFFAETIFGNAIHRMEAWVAQQEKGAHRPLSLGTLLKGSIDPAANFQKRVEETLHMNAELIRTNEKGLVMLGILMNVPSFRLLNSMVVVTLGSRGTFKSVSVAPEIREMARQTECHLKLLGDPIQEPPLVELPQPLAKK